ncbi:MAG TPA: FHA domain-containing protein [Pirellulaceae bacterium]|jgi:predicted component of type VI protein secretion system
MLSNVKLVVVSGEVKTKEINVKLPSTIGRGRDLAVVLPHPLVSRNHCELYEAAGKLMVRDLGSLNGTFINNERITESPLAPGELLTVGTVTFRAVYNGGSKPGDDSKTMSLPKASDKTVKVNKAGTVPAKPKQKPIVEESDEELLDVDFGKPLFPAEEMAPGGGGHVTQRIPKGEADDQSKTPAKGNKPVQKPAPKPAPKPPATPKMADSDSGGLSSSSDDGLDDFLKDLKK